MLRATTLARHEHSKARGGSMVGEEGSHSPAVIRCDRYAAPEASQNCARNSMETSLSVELYSVPVALLDKCVWLHLS